MKTFGEHIIPDLLRSATGERVNRASVATTFGNG